MDFDIFWPKCYR